MFDADEIEELRIQYRNEAINAVREAEKRGYEKGIKNSSKLIQSKRQYHVSSYLLKIIIDDFVRHEESGFLKFTTKSVPYYVIESKLYHLSDRINSAPTVLFDIKQERRHREFQQLYNTLNNNYPCNIVPVLPTLGKHSKLKSLHSKSILATSISGSDKSNINSELSDSLVLWRKQQLALWLQFIVLNPYILRTSKELSQFLGNSDLTILQKSVESAKTTQLTQTHGIAIPTSLIVDSHDVTVFATYAKQETDKDKDETGTHIMPAHSESRSTMLLIIARRRLHAVEKHVDIKRVIYKQLIDSSQHWSSSISQIAFAYLDAAVNKGIKHLLQLERRCGSLQDQLAWRIYQDLLLRSSKSTLQLSSSIQFHLQDSLEFLGPEYLNTVTNVLKACQKYCATDMSSKSGESASVPMSSKLKAISILETDWALSNTSVAHLILSQVQSVACELAIQHSRIADEWKLLSRQLFEPTVDTSTTITGTVAGTRTEQTARISAGISPIISKLSSHCWNRTQDYIWNDVYKHISTSANIAISPNALLHNNSDSVISILGPKLSHHISEYMSATEKSGTSSWTDEDTAYWEAAATGRPNRTGSSASISGLSGISGRSEVDSILEDFTTRSHGGLSRNSSPDPISRLEANTPLSQSYKIRFSDVVEVDIEKQPHTPKFNQHETSSSFKSEIWNNASDSDSEIDNDGNLSNSSKTSKSGVLQSAVSQTTNSTRTMASKVKFSFASSTSTNSDTGSPATMYKTIAENEDSDESDTDYFNFHKKYNAANLTSSNSTINQQSFSDTLLQQNQQRHNRFSGEDNASVDENSDDEQGASIYRDYSDQLDSMRPSDKLKISDFRSKNTSQQRRLNRMQNAPNASLRRAPLTNPADTTIGSTSAINNFTSTQSPSVSNSANTNMLSPKSEIKNSPNTTSADTNKSNSHHSFQSSALGNEAGIPNNISNSTGWKPPPRRREGQVPEAPTHSSTPYFNNSIGHIGPDKEPSLWTRPSQSKAEKQPNPSTFPANSTAKTAFNTSSDNSKQDYHASNAQRNNSGNTLLPGWQEAQTTDGRVYYYNLNTRETRWDPPIDYSTSAQGNSNSGSNKSTISAHETSKTSYKDDIRIVIESWRVNPHTRSTRPIHDLINTAYGILPFIQPKAPGTALLSTSPPSQVKKEYLKLVRLIHPDKLSSDCEVGNKALAEAVFIVVSEAFESYRQVHHV